MSAVDYAAESEGNLDDNASGGVEGECCSFGI